MRSVDQWLGMYAESHRNPTNKIIHWICVPLIVWSVVALLYVIPAPLTGMWAWVALFSACAYYSLLSRPLTLGLAVSFLVLLVITAVTHSGMSDLNLALLAIAVFVLAWIGQFVGHQIEGKRPSFFTDLAFLLIGPAWLMAHLYRRAGLRY